MEAGIAAPATKTFPLSSNVQCGRSARCFGGQYCSTFLRRGRIILRWLRRIPRDSLLR